MILPFGQLLMAIRDFLQFSNMPSKIIGFAKPDLELLKTKKLKVVVGHTDTLNSRSKH